MTLNDYKISNDIERCASLWAYCQNYFSVGLCNNFAARLLLYFPAHLKHVTTLPCETSVARSLSSSKSVLRRTEIARQSALRNGRHSLSFHVCFYFTRPVNPMSGQSLARTCEYNNKFIVHIWSNYDATRVHSADNAVARCLFVRLSVRHTLAFCRHRWTYPQNNFFIVSGEPHHSSFPYKTLWQYYNGNPPTETSNARGYEKNRDFWPISRFITEMMQVRATVIMEGEYETAPKLSNGTISNDLEWPLTVIFQGHGII